MENKETAIYLNKIKSILEKEGEKISFNVFLILPEDKEEFSSLLMMEKIMYNKKLYIESTNALKANALNRLNELDQPNSALEKMALEQILMVLNETPKTSIENLTLCRKILVPKSLETIFLDNINKTVISRSKPLRDASKADIEDLTLDIKLSQEQNKRIKDYVKVEFLEPIPVEENISLNEMIEDLDTSIKSLEQKKLESLEISDEQDDIDPYKKQIEKYKDYLQDCYTKAIKLDDEVGQLYYEEMLLKLKDTNIIEEPGYLYQTKNKL